jgi:hypothetical protein
MSLGPYLLRVPAEELPDLKKLFEQFPSVSPQEIFRACVLCCDSDQVQKALELLAKRRITRKKGGRK